MADYIERDELLADLRLARSLTPGLPYEGPMAKIMDTFFDMIAAYPAADVAPVKWGRWVGREAQHEDSEETYTVRYTACDQCGMSRSAGLGLANFCPNCGAKMS